MPNNTDIEWRDEADVIIVGGGGAGLAAAVSAGESGASTMLLEKCPNIGGTTGIAIGSYTASCTSFQEDADIEDDPMAHNEDIGEFAPQYEERNNWELRQMFVENSGETLEWLRTFGIEFYGPSQEPPNRVPRMHNVIPNSKAYIYRLQRKALKQGTEFYMSTRAQRLLQNEGGCVIGVAAEEDNGSEFHLKAVRGVVLAAGDYANSFEMKRCYQADDIAAIEGINPNALGEGHQMAIDIGAATVNMDIFYGPEIRFVPPPRKPFTQVLPSNVMLAKLASAAIALTPKALMNRFIKKLIVTWQHPENNLFERGAILVNSEGKRFTNELEHPRAEVDISRQPGKIAYLVFDGKLAERFSAWPNFISTAPDIAYAYMKDYRSMRPDIYHEAPSLNMLAQRIGLGATALSRTVECYNRAARGEAQEEFGRRGFGEPLDTAPFYALGPAKAYIPTTEGGLRINHNFQVLREDDSAIEGLYAVGCTGMGGMVIWGHGLHIAWAMTSGRLVGRALGQLGV